MKKWEKMKDKQIVVIVIATNISIAYWGKMKSYEM